MSSSSTTSDARGGYDPTGDDLPVGLGTRSAELPLPDDKAQVFRYNLQQFTGGRKPCPIPPVELLQPLYSRGYDFRVHPAMGVHFLDVLTPEERSAWGIALAHAPHPSIRAYWASDEEKRIIFGPPPTLTSSELVRECMAGAYATPGDPENPSRSSESVIPPPPPPLRREPSFSALSPTQLERQHTRDLSSISLTRPLSPAETSYVNCTSCAMDSSGKRTYLAMLAEDVRLRCVNHPPNGVPLDDWRRAYHHCPVLYPARYVGEQRALPSYQSQTPSNLGGTLGVKVTSCWVTPIVEWDGSSWVLVGSDIASTNSTMLSWISSALSPCSRRCMGHPAVRAEGYLPPNWLREAEARRPAKLARTTAWMHEATKCRKPHVCFSNDSSQACTCARADPVVGTRTNTQGGCVRSHGNRVSGTDDVRQTGQATSAPTPSGGPGQPTPGAPGNVLSRPQRPLRLNELYPDLRWRAGTRGAAVYEVTRGHAGPNTCASLLVPAVLERFRRLAREHHWEAVEQRTSPDSTGWRSDLPRDHEAWDGSCADVYLGEAGTFERDVVFAVCASGYGPPSYVGHGVYEPLLTDGGSRDAPSDGGEGELAALYQWGEHDEPGRLRLIALEESPIVLIEEVGDLPVFPAVVAASFDSTRGSAATPSMSTLDVDAVLGDIGRWATSACAALGGGPSEAHAMASRNPLLWGYFATRAMNHLAVVRHPVNLSPAWRVMFSSPLALSVSEEAARAVLGPEDTEEHEREWLIDVTPYADLRPRGAEVTAFTELCSRYDAQFVGDRVPAGRTLNLNALSISLAFGVAPRVRHIGENVEFRWPLQATQRMTGQVVRPDPVVGTRTNTQGGCVRSHGTRVSGTDDVKQVKGVPQRKAKGVGPNGQQVTPTPRRKESPGHDTVLKRMAEMERRMAALQAKPASKPHQGTPTGKPSALKSPNISSIVHGAGAYDYKKFTRGAAHMAGHVLTAAGRAGANALALSVAQATGSPALGALVKKGVESTGNLLIKAIGGEEYVGSGAYVRVGMSHGVADLTEVPMGEAGPLHILVSFTDPIGALTMPASTVTSTTTLTLAATNAALFPQGSCMAPCAGYWRLHQMVLTYRSTLPPALNTGTLGYIVFAHSSNADATVPQTRRGQMSMEGAASGTPLENLILGVECDPALGSGARFLAVDYSATVDPDLAAHGTLIITCTGGTATGGLEVGQLWNTYTMELIRGVPSPTRDARAHIVRTTAGGSAPFGTTASSSYVKNITVAVTSSAIVIYGLLNGDCLKCEYFTLGTAATYAQPTITYTSGSALTVYNNYQSSSVGPSIGVSTSALTIQSAVMYTGGPGVPLTITWTGATLPTAATMDFNITVVGNGLSTQQL